MGMGNPLLDISSEVGQDMLDKYDVKLDSAILAEEKHLPMYNELIEKYSPQYIAGGATQNSIRVAQWMLSNAGKEKSTAFMGCVGSDSNGEKLESCAASDGVLAHYLKDAEQPTGTCAVLVKDGERSLIANLGAANHFKPSHLDTPLAKSIVDSAKFCYIAGFFLTVSVESLEQVAKQFASTDDKIFAMNLSAPFIIDFFTEQLKTALPYTDFVFCNESEAEAFGKKFEFGSDLKEVALKLSAYEKVNASRKRTVVFTQGSQPTIVACDGVVTEYPVELLPKEKLVDTNGAGDAFVGGFLAELAQNKSIKDAVEAGHWAARYIIQQSGCTLTDKCSYYSS